MKTNTYGLKMLGLKKASGATCEWTGHTQIAYDTATGKVLTSDHIGSSWTEYHDPAVLYVCHTSRHLTMQQIADMIYERYIDRENALAYLSGRLSPAEY